jgi:hypothetical protein
MANGPSAAGPSFPTADTSPRDMGLPKLSTDPHVPFPQIVTFASWEAVGFFLSLHMRHQHVLTPLVHQPSFARDLLHRRDVHDEAFRGLLLSIGQSVLLSWRAGTDIYSGIYVGHVVSSTLLTGRICQVPIHTLLDQMPRPELESLCRRCQRASRAIQVRHQMRPNKTILASTVL